MAERERERQTVQNNVKTQHNNNHHQQAKKQPNSQLERRMIWVQLLFRFKNNSFISFIE